MGAIHLAKRAPHRAQGAEIDGAHALGICEDPASHPDDRPSLRPFGGTPPGPSTQPESAMGVLNNPETRFRGLFSKS